MKLFGISVLFPALIWWINVNPLIADIPSGVSMSDYVFIVDISSQKNYLFYKKTLIEQFLVSTGSKNRYKGNREMKAGIWRLTDRIKKNLAPIYGARLIYLEKYNPVTQTFIQTNKAFHGTNEPHNIGQPTSMGCVYHYDQDMIDLFEFIPRNTIVITKK